MTSFGEETVTIKTNFGCHPWRLNPLSFACEKEALAMGYLPGWQMKALNILSTQLQFCLENNSEYQSSNEVVR